MTTGSLYPLFLKLAGARVLVVGGGEICAQKLPPLVHAGAKIEIVSPELSERVAGVVRRGDATHTPRSFHVDDVQGARVVIAATDDEATNRIVYDAATAAGILVNVVDVPALCDFYTGGIVRRGPLTVVVGSSGKAPGLSRALREHLEHLLPKALTPLAAAVSEGRKRAPNLWSTFAGRAPRLTQLARYALCHVMEDGGEAISPRIQERVTLVRAAVFDIDLDERKILDARVFGDVFENAEVDVKKIGRPDGEEIVRVLSAHLGETGRFRCTCIPGDISAHAVGTEALAPQLKSGALSDDDFDIVYDTLVPLAVL